MKYIRIGEKTLQRLEKKFKINLSKSIKNQKILIFIGILQLNISTIFKLKKSFLFEETIDKVLSDENIIYLYEDNLLFDIDFIPKCDNLPDCSSNIIGIEIKKGELVTLSNVVNISQITNEETNYVSSRLKDYLSNDQSNLFGEIGETYKKTLRSIKENGVQEKSKQNIFKNESSKSFENSLIEGGVGAVEINELKKSFISIEINKEMKNDEDSNFDETQNKELTNNFEKGFRDLNKKESRIINNIIKSKQLVPSSNQLKMKKTHHRNHSIGNYHRINIMDLLTNRKRGVNFKIDFDSELFFE